jgi:hypothetical protein
MPNEMSILDEANAFATTACKLLVEYTARLVAIKQEVLKIQDQLNDLRGSKMELRYLRQRFNNEKDQFFRSKGVYEVLTRKASQWIEHGKSPRPDLQMELEVRLADFENTLRSTEEFFYSSEM